MAARFDGLVCVDRFHLAFGFVVFCVPEVGPVRFECSMWAWPATDEGREGAKAQLQRVLDRLAAEESWPGLRALQVA